MNSQFGKSNQIRLKKQHLFLLNVETSIEINTIHLSGFEKGIRQLNLFQISIFAQILNASCEKLMKLCLADRRCEALNDEEMVNEELNITK